MCNNDDRCVGKVHSLLIALTIISELTLSSLYLELEHSRTFHVRMYSRTFHVRIYCVLLEVVISPY